MFYIRRAVKEMSATKFLGIYSDGMVFQRNKEIIIEGTESNLTEVKVTFAGAVKTAAVENGKFKDEWVADYKSGLSGLDRMENEQKKLQIETVGKEVRSLFQKK